MSSDPPISITLGFATKSWLVDDVLDEDGVKWLEACWFGIGVDIGVG